MIEFAPLQQRRSGAAFTLVELLVVIGIIAILAALAFPVLGRMQRSGKMTQSMSNLRAAGEGLLMYAGENDGSLPKMSAVGYKAPFWPETISKYIAAPVKDLTHKGSTSSPTLLSPFLKRHDDATKSEHHAISDYAANPEVILRDDSRFESVEGVRLVNVQRPGETAMLVTSAEKLNPLKAGWYVESWWYMSQSGNTVGPNDHGSGKIQFVCVDGHVEALTKQDFDARKQQILLNDPKFHPAPYGYAR